MFNYNKPPLDISTLDIDPHFPRYLDIMTESINY